MNLSPRDNLLYLGFTGACRDKRGRSVFRLNLYGHEDSVETLMAWLNENGMTHVIVDRYRRPRMLQHGGSKTHSTITAALNFKSSSEYLYAKLCWA